MSSPWHCSVFETVVTSVLSQILIAASKQMLNHLSVKRCKISKLQNMIVIIVRGKEKISIPFHSRVHKAELAAPLS